MIAKRCVPTFHAVKLAWTLLAVTKKISRQVCQKNFVQRSIAANHKSTASIKLIHAHIAPKFDFTAYFTTEMGLAFGTKACCCFPTKVLFGDSIHKNKVAILANYLLFFHLTGNGLHPNKQKPFIGSAKDSKKVGLSFCF
jgi:hypothetical protein